MPYYCTVPRCTSMAGKAKNVSFHQFPRDEELARLWNDILKRGKPYTKYSKVCSLHFRPEDYTITSVGKNKGQWRTLRKDAVPSQNLPSETPAPYSRKQWDSWSQNGCTPSVIDPSIHQHMAQAIYMQTMLAMQASGNTEPHQTGPQIPEMAHTSTQGDMHTNESNSDNISYKCEECTKCFKDPDVYILHKRSHARKSNGVEKENFNVNLTLRSNPILANLLKSNNDAIDPNLVTMENLLITALAANMDYIRNFSINKELGDSNSNEQSDLNDSNHDRSGLNHERNGLDHERSGLDHERSGLYHERSGLDHERSSLDHERSDSNVRLHRDISDRELENDSDPIDSNETLRRSIDRGVLSYAPCLSRNDQYAEVMKNGDENNLNSSSNQQSVIHHSKSDNYSQNRQKSEANHVKSDAIHKKSDGDDKKSEPIGLSYAMNFSTKLSDSESLKYTGNYYRDRCSPEYEGDPSHEEVNIQNGSVRSHSDDFNESLDSNSLVIDENV